LATYLATEKLRTIESNINNSVYTKAPLTITKRTQYRTDSIHAVGDITFKTSIFKR